MREDEMVGWHHRLNGHEFEQAPGVGMDWEAGVLRSLGSQRVRHNRAIEQQQYGNIYLAKTNIQPKGTLWYKDTYFGYGRYRLY